VQLGDSKLRAVISSPTLGDLGVQPRPLEEFLAVFKDKYT
jgi:hypothetical protein